MTDHVLEHQVGGDHYRKHNIQPVEYIIANGIGFLPGNIIKYATRYKDKGGAQDIRKLIQYAELILEFEYGENAQAADINKAPTGVQPTEGAYASIESRGSGWVYGNFDPDDYKLAKG